MNRLPQEFAKGKEDFVAKVLKERYPDESARDTVSAEDMSEFYKAHLDARWRDHLQYNLEWQSRNFREEHSLFLGGKCYHKYI